jgi:hypothetical protein
MLYWAAIFFIIARSQQLVVIDRDATNDAAQRGCLRGSGL